ncbi:DUF4179 domain-containing protein [Lederbergia citrea]|uniref:DUF4179 domain-containing protein n=1 Tax=Lederbergia citrea TaxID=2833581 RepID=A0A942Z4B5_9BACI|nr:DUF4179 domain-containing protein [Lederbergia citrea]MBS4179425.1 DUF4179 domain-containing protein [Lederbergia citrea]MBS4206093.1 DUF4179 domain-containing protein [Lederbergia citrea]MBS4224458.1 DUF4179 domain-containing protein [Lederbergia citrea]
MNTKFEKEFDQVMNEKKEMPINVRQSLDKSYDIIRARSKKKKNSFIWKRITAAACALIATGIVLSNEHVIASINNFFNFGDKGIERAVTEGFTQESNSTDTDQNIKITLKQHFSDSNKLGVSFQLEFEDPTILKNDVREISMDYRLKNGDGEYIVEFIPDTKSKKGNSGYISSLEDQNPILDVKTGKVQYDVIIDSNKGVIPSLNDAVIEVESVNVFYVTEGLKKIDGKWDLPVANKEKGKSIAITEFTMHDQSSNIHVSSAKANPTSLNLTFSVNKVFENESPFVEKMKIIDKEGNEYHPDGFSIETKNNKTIISTNFPITSYNNSKKLKLIVEDIGEVELLKK